MPTDYLKWTIANVDEYQKFYMLANAETKRREFNPFYNFDKNISRIEFGKYKDELWIDVPVDYLKWIKDTFDEDSKAYSISTMIVSWQDNENEYVAEVSIETEPNKDKKIKRLR